jgi:hypothetical protein
LRLGSRVKVGVLLHAGVNLAFAAQALGLTAAGPEPAAVRPVVASEAVVVALRPATAPSGPPIGSSRAADTPATSSPPPPSTVRVAPVKAATAASKPTTTTTVRGADRDLTAERFDRLAQCESDGDPRAVNGPYRGAFQFLLTTWHDAGGAGDPVDASYGEQQRVAMAWARVVDPASQWPVCWPLTA